MAVMKREIKRVNVFSVVKTLFVLGGFGGFVIGFIQWAFLSLMLQSVRQSGLGGMDLLPGLDNVFGAGIGVLGFILPLFGAIMGAVFGVIFGFILAGVYNVAARLWGGLEIELAEIAAPQPFMPAAPHRDRTEPTPLPASTPPPAETPRRDVETDSPPPPSFE